MRSVDAARRQRVATLLGWCIGGSSGALVLQGLYLRNFAAIVSGLAFATISFGAAEVARRGRGMLAGLLLSGLPCLGSLIAVAASGELGGAPFAGVLGIIVALATLEGRALRFTLGLAVGCAFFILAIALQRGVTVPPTAQLLASGLALVAMSAIVAFVHARTFDALLEKVAAEQAHAADAENRYRAIALNTQDLVALIDAPGVVRYASASFVRVLGFDATGMQATKAFVDEPDASAFDTLLTLARAGQAARSDVRRKRADGTAGRFECALSPTAAGEVLCVARDVTAERGMALELEQSRKMEALGRFAGSIAHDFNNLLSVMRTCSTLAADAIAPDSPARADLNDVQEAVSRASGLTSQLLSFSRRDVVVAARVELGPPLQRAAELARRLLGSSIKLEAEIPADLWAVLTGPSQLDQIVMNLAANARDAMPSGGTLRLVAHNEPQSPIGEAVLISISDSGMGMSAETRAHLFEPFFTTKPVGIGTGLGLATVFGVVKALGGQIEVHSEPSQGTEFRIWLPRALERATPIPAQAPRAPVRRSTSHVTVLVVDDDADVRGLMVRLISSEGFQVISAADSAQALEQAAQLAELPVLVTDVHLPGSEGGVWLAKRLLDRFPSMRVVLVSGFAPDPQATARLIGEGARFVQKPFSPGALVFAVRESLGLTPTPNPGAMTRPRVN